MVESGGKNIEIAVMTREHGLRQLDEAEIDAIVAEIEAEKAAAEAAKKGPPKDTWALPFPSLLHLCLSYLATSLKELKTR